MGKAIEKIALTKEYKIHSIVNCQSDLKKIDLSTADIGIEFTNPKSAFENISFCLKSNLPIVSGSTGWLAELKTIEKICEKYNGSFLHSSNFSLSMNKFLNVSKRLARDLKNYDISILEKHHIQLEHRDCWFETVACSCLLHLKLYQISPDENILLRPFLFAPAATQF